MNFFSLCHWIKSFSFILLDFVALNQLVILCTFSVKFGNHLIQMNSISKQKWTDMNLPINLMDFTGGNVFVFYWSWTYPPAQILHHFRNYRNIESPNLNGTQTKWWTFFEFLWLDEKVGLCFNFILQLFAKTSAKSENELIQKGMSNIREEGENYCSIFSI